MSAQEFVTPIRGELAAHLRAKRRALYDLRIALDRDGLTIGRITAGWANEEFAIREFCRGIEDVTGFAILSATRAQARRDGNHVN